MLEFITYAWQIKLGTWVLCALLKWIGERWQHNAQRFILPAVYTTGACLIVKTWFVHVPYLPFPLPLALLILPMIAPIDLGYKFYGGIDSVDRAAWLFVITVVAGLAFTLYGFESWFAYVPICITSGFIGTWVRNKNNNWGAPVNGLTLAFHIIWLHPLIIRIH